MSDLLRPLLNRLRHLIERRWNITLSFLSDHDANEQYSFPLEFGGTPQALRISKGNLNLWILPIYQHHILLGAILFAASTIAEEEIQDIADFAQCMISDVLALREELRLTQRLLEQLQAELGEVYSYGPLLTRNKTLKRQWDVLDEHRDEVTPLFISGEKGTGRRQLINTFAEKSGVQEIHFCDEPLTHSSLIELQGFFLISLSDDLPFHDQDELSRFLHFQKLHPTVGPRVIAISDLPFEDLLESPAFRPSLLHRLGQIVLSLPPLRKRQDDILLLIDYRLRKTSNGKLTISDCTHQVLSYLMDYRWERNVEELFEVIDDVVRHSKEGTVTADLLPEEIVGRGTRKALKEAKRASCLPEAMTLLERELIRECLERTNWNKSQVSKELGISRSGLIQKCEKYRLTNLCSIR